MSDFPAAVIWDLDGTLIDSAPDICRALNAVLVESGLPSLDEAAVRTMIGDGVVKLVERGFTALDRPLSEADRRSKIELFMLHYATDPAGRTKLYPGASAALTTLAQAGVRQAICTNKPEAISRAVLSDLGVAEHFAAIVGGDTTACRKPDPLPLVTCLDALGIAHSDAVMIGDSAVDAATARALNMPVGLVTYGYVRGDANSIGADFLIDDLTALPDILRSMTAKAKC